MGTNFSAYVCLNNESEEGVSEVCVKAEMRHLGSREVLVPRVVRVGIEEVMREETVSLQPHEALHQIIHQSTFPSRNDPIRRYPVSQVSIRPYFVLQFLASVQFFSGRRADDRNTRKRRPHT